MRDPFHTAEWPVRALGAPTLLSGRHESSTGSYAPPVERATDPSEPPHTINSFPVQTSTCTYRAEGAPALEVGAHTSAGHTSSGSAAGAADATLVPAAFAKRATSTGSARHSAIRRGSFASAAK